MQVARPESTTVPSLFIRRLARDPLALSGMTLVVAFIVVALAAPLIAPHDPTAVNELDILRDPSLEYPLGTDNLGRDVLSRVIHGARWSLGSMVAAGFLTVSIGIALGAVAGYYGGVVDGVIMRIADIVLAVPGLILALAISGMLGPGLVSVLIGIVSAWWAEYARITRGLVLGIRERRFVEAARGLGIPRRWILVRHILPNALPPVVVLATLEMGELLLAIAALNFLGLGVQPPFPEWGAMLNEGRRFLFVAPRLMIFPGLAISFVVMGFNLMGDGLRDVLDPRLVQGR